MNILGVGGCSILMPDNTFILGSWVRSEYYPFFAFTGCEDYPFWGQAVADIEHGLDFILFESVETPELETSFDEPYDMTSSISSGILCSVGTISVNSKLQPTSWIKSYKLWCQARSLLLSVQVADKMPASKLILYFLIIP